MINFFVLAIILTPVMCLLMFAICLILVSVMATAHPEMAERITVTPYVDRPVPRYAEEPYKSER